MKKFFFSLLFALQFSFLFSQTDTTGLTFIKNEAISNSKAIETLIYMCDVIGPRLMWSPAYKSSAEWVKGKLIESGITNVYFEDINKKGYGWTLKKFHAAVLKPFNINIIGIPKEWTKGTNGSITAEVIHLNAQNEQELEAYKGKVNGKIVMLSPASPLRMYTAPIVARFTEDSLKKLSEYIIPSQSEKDSLKKIENAGLESYLQFAEFNIRKIRFCIDEGALLTIEPGYGYYGLARAWGSISLEKPNDIFDYLISNSGKQDNSNNIPQITISMEQYNSIARALANGAKVEMEVNIEIQSTGLQDGFNIIAEIPGSDLKNEIVLLGGHFDSYTYATAATDNTTGVVACLEAIRIFKQLGIQPRRTIRIGLWAAEEEGLWGSKAHIEKHFKNGSEKCYAYFNMDFGAGRFRGICSEENTAAAHLFKDWMKIIADPKFQTVCLMKTKNSDHEAFQNEGLNGFAFIQDMMDYWKTYHTNMDFIERVYKEDYLNDIYIFSAFAWLAANRDGDFPKK